MSAILGLVGTFFYTWVQDEAEEEGLTFDTLQQKHTVTDHVDKVPTVEMKVKMERDEDFQKQVLEILDELAHQVKDNKEEIVKASDQQFQTKEEIRKINDYIESDH